MAAVSIWLMALTSALMLHGVMEFNLPQAATDYATIANKAFPELGSLPESDRAGGMIQALRYLIAAIGLPGSLDAAGIPEEVLCTMASKAMVQTHLIINNPHRLTLGDAIEIYRKARHRISGLVTHVWIGRQSCYRRLPTSSIVPTVSASSANPSMRRTNTAQRKVEAKGAASNVLPKTNRR